MSKNRICLIITALFLALPVIALPEEVGNEAQTNETIVETVEEQSSVSEDSVLKEEEPAPYKQPVSKKKIAKKFLMAMLGVAGSSFIIYFGLTLYNKYREVAKVVKNEHGENSLETPDNLESAIKTFIDKTRWS